MTPATPRELLWQAAWTLARHRGHEADFHARFPASIADVDVPLIEHEGQLGDLLETLRSDERARDFRALIDGTLRASGSVGNATTQRFTPAWIAAWLAREGLAARRAGAPTPCLDPACGGGRLLLSLYEHGVRAEHLHGMDIDPLAVDVSRWAIWLRGRRDSSVPGSPHLTEVQPPLGALGGDASARFGLVVANPPYMGARHLAPGVRNHLREAMAPYHGDLYTAFLGRALGWTVAGGAVAFLCQHSFLFVRRDRALRRDFLARAGLKEILHLGPHAFPGIQGEKAAVVAFTAVVGEPSAPRVVDLRDLKPAANKRAGLDDPARHHDGHRAAARAATGESFAYWLAPQALDRLDRGPLLGDVLDVAGSSNKTASNQRFLRRWWEVPHDEIGPGRPWVRYAKGGPFRRWRGNLERVCDWSDSARAHYASHATANLLPERYWYREGITWSDFGGLRFSARLLPAGGAFDMAGPALFVPDDAPGGLLFWLALLNTDLACNLLNALNPTIHYQVGDLRRLPIPDAFPEATVHRVVRGALDAMRAMDEVDRHAHPASPDYTTPAVLQFGEDWERAVERADQWWRERWQAEQRARDSIEAAVADLYALPSTCGDVRAPGPPNWQLLVEDHLRGMDEGRYPTVEYPASIAHAGRRRRPWFKTPWHASRCRPPG